ncbi:MAG: acetate--CoA ligase family protein [Acidobacteria bacterium]|nr:acetate--CoA ligase family protein [Candidatus Sulfomarinibacter sp. MAG AM2]
MSLERFVKPRSIAVFGGYQAQEVIRQSDLMGYDGEIWPVHPKKDEILGRKVFRSVADLPGSPDAAYVGVNRNLTIDIVRDLAARNAGGAICYATGFTEAGEEGSELEKQLLEASGDMPLVGPNCYGILNYLDGAMLWPDQQGGRRVEEGVAIITASSNVAFNLSMQRRGLPIAYMMSLGNQLKFKLEDAMLMFAREERVTALGLYLEAMSDPKAFEEAVNVARDLGKPIVAIKTGRSDVAQKIVVSHTASMAGSDALVNDLFDRLGVARVDSLEALMESLKVLHVLGPLDGGRVAAMSTSGGDLTLLADAMIGSNLTMPPLSEGVTQRLREVVHERMVAANPLDFQMFDWDNEDRMAATFTPFVSEGFDVSLCLLDYPREDLCDQSTWGGAERGFVRAVHDTDTRGAVLSTFSDTISESVAARLISQGIAPLAGIEEGLAGVQAAVDVGAAWRRPRRRPLLARIADGKDLVDDLDEAESKALLAGCGVPIPASKVVRDGEEAAVAAGELGFPVAVKVLGIAHKTEAGGVKLNLCSSDEVAAAVAEMSDLGETFLVEKMIEGVVAELIVGIARDDQFGPYLLIGAGGILVELMKDSRSLLLPVDRDQVVEALGALKSAPLFRGFRGRPNADLNAAADAIMAIAALVEEDPGAIEELDVNPLMLLADGAGVVAADALIRMRQQ